MKLSGGHFSESARMQWNDSSTLFVGGGMTQAVWELLVNYCFSVLRAPSLPFVYVFIMMLKKRYGQNTISFSVLINFSVLIIH